MYKFCIKLNKPAGYHYQSMCAYITGLLGSSQMASTDQLLATKELTQEEQKFFDSHIIPQYNDDLCEYLPTDVSPNDSNELYMTFDCELPSEILSLMKSRALKYADDAGVKVMYVHHRMVVEDVLWKQEFYT